MSAETPLRVWISGASEGIGRATALAFARAGARLAICARRAGPLAATARELHAAGASAVAPIPADVSSQRGVATFSGAALSALGGVDVLVHAAGGGGPASVVGGPDATFEADWDYAFGVNLMAAARLARLAAPHLPDGRGVIALVSSAFGFQSMDITAPSYGATKAGLHHLTVTLAHELGPRGIRVVGIAPGPIWTESWERDLVRDAAAAGRDAEELRAETHAEIGAITALKRPGTADELARAVVWLSSPDASFITGTTLAVDGGYIRSPR